MKKAHTLVGALVLTCGSASALAFDDITPVDAYYLAGTDANTYILDVRTDAEWKWVGHPGANKLGEGAALAGKVLNVSYSIERKGTTIVNPSFLSDVNEIFGNAAEEVVLITMCRSGQRSVAAANALEAAGYRVKNMVTGFQGSSDMYGYRSINGWANDGLPYSYSAQGAYAD